MLVSRRYALRTRTDNLRLHASDVAALCGFNPYKKPGELAYKYIYGGFKGIVRWHVALFPAVAHFSKSFCCKYGFAFFPGVHLEEAKRPTPTYPLNPVFPNF